MAKLIAQSGHSLDLPRRRVTLGESSTCDIPLATGLGLAARHFEIEPSPEGNYVVRDVSGGAGTMVNGVVVQEQVLHHGNVITAGGLRLGFWNTELPQQPEESPFLAGARSTMTEESPPPLIPETASAPPEPPAAEASVPSTESVTAPAPPPLPVSEGPPVAWVNPAEEKSRSQAAADPSSVRAPQSESATITRMEKPRRVWSQSYRKLAGRRAVIGTSLTVLGCVAVLAVRTDAVQKALSPHWTKVSTWVTTPRPATKAAPAQASDDTSSSTITVSDPADSITPKANHNDVVKRMLTERTLSLFQADLTQLVPFYNASASARNLPPQREMTEAFRKHYGILLDGFDRLTCLRARGKDEFLFVLSASSRVNIESILGIPASRAKDSAAAKTGTTRIYPVKTVGRVYGVAQYDPFTVILGQQSWIDTALNSGASPSLREALCLFPDTASRNPGALIMVERVTTPGGGSTPSAFETAVSNLFFNGKGESRLTLTRNPEVKESQFVEQSGKALKEQARALMQAVKVSEALTVGGAGKGGKNAAPVDSGEIITTAEASIIIPDGDALLREAIDSVAHTFMSQSPSVELILAAQKAVFNFNQARLKQAPEAQSVTAVAEALELLQSGISVRGPTAGSDRVYQIERLEPNQADELVHLLAMEDKAGLVFRPNTDHISGSLLELAVKARDYRNAELLISLWSTARLSASGAADVNSAVRKVMEWAGGEGARQRISVGLPSLTSEEYKNAVALLSIQNGQLTWKPGEEGYRTWLRRINPDPKGDAKRIAGIYDDARKAGAIPQGKVEGLADAVRLINSGVRSGAGTRSMLFSTGNLSVDELRAAARYLRYESGAVSVVER